MRLYRVIIILAAVAYVVGQIVNERKRLASVERLPGPAAREFHERGRLRAERALVVLTVVCSTLGIAALLSMAGVLP